MSRGGLRCDNGQRLQLGGRASMRSAAQCESCFKCTSIRWHKKYQTGGGGGGEGSTIGGPQIEGLSFINRVSRVGS